MLKITEQGPTCTAFRQKLTVNKAPPVLCSGRRAEGAGQCGTEEGQSGRGSAALHTCCETGSKQPPAVQQSLPGLPPPGPVLPGSAGCQAGH